MGSWRLGSASDEASSLGGMDVLEASERFFLPSLSHARPRESRAVVVLGVDFVSVSADGLGDGLVQNALPSKSRVAVVAILPTHMGGSFDRS